MDTGIASLETKSTCCYCGVGCGVIIEHDGAHISSVRGDPDHPANFGRLCTKGATLHLSNAPDARAKFPVLRTKRDAQRNRVDWNVALDHAAEKFSQIIRKHGPDAVAFYISGQLLTEDYYVFNKLAKGLIGTNNVDSNSRLCMSSAVAGYKATLGADAPPVCYEDIDHAECIFIAGSNTAFAHPILYRRIEDARAKNPALKIIVVDPRKTDTAREADLHLAILPGTDVALYNSMLHVMLQENLCDLDYLRNHTTGFDVLKLTVRDYTPQMVADVCDVPAEDIVKAAKWFAESKATLSMYCQGLNQSTHGTHNNAALINLHLATAHIGKPGAGPLSLTGQPNAMGGREVGGMANLMSAHRDMANADHRAEVSKLWGVDAVPAVPGKTAVEMFEAVRNGSIKAIWIACTNPAQSMPDAKLISEALQKAEFVVVQEAYANTDTTAFADLLLPATTWGEKDGVVTNSERRITRVRAAVSAPGEAKHDWQIARDFALKLGEKIDKPQAAKMFAYKKPEDIFNDHRESTKGRDLDITGLSYALLESKGAQQWPFPEGATSGKSRLYADGKFPTADGRAKIFNAVYQPTAEKTNSRYPLHFNTGRLRDHWHGMSRSGNVARLFNHEEEPLLTMNATDMARRHLVDGDIVRVNGLRGEIAVRVAASDTLRVGQTFLPMHWGARFMNSAGANALTINAFDALSKQPELKHAAVQVSKLDAPWQLVVMRKASCTHSATQLMQGAQPLLKKFAYASLGLFGRDEPCVIFRAASGNTQLFDYIEQIDNAFDIQNEHSLNYLDKQRGISKRVMLRDGCVEGVRLTGETVARDWLKDLMAQNMPTDNMREWMLAPVQAPPVGSVMRGRIVCNCLDVSEKEIVTEFSRGSDLPTLQSKLKCGSECGSCLPELKRLATIHFQKAA
jgi:assimilatory nitrate reductase catalytic subunit